MYQGSNPTALQSQELIGKAMSELLGNTAYSKISISTICKEAGVSRQTFYTLFESKENIILFLLQEHTFQPGECCMKKSLSLEMLAKGYANYIIEKEPLLRRLEQNGVLDLMQGGLAEGFLSCSSFLGILEQNDPLRREFAGEFVAGGLTGIARAYLRQNPPISQEDLETLIYELFSGNILD